MMSKEIVSKPPKQNDELLKGAFEEKVEDMKTYEWSLKDKRDAESVRLTAERIGMEKGLEEGLEKGMEKGMEKGIEKGKTEVVENLLSTGKFSFSEIADFAAVSEDFVKEIDAKMNTTNKK